MHFASRPGRARLRPGRQRLCQPPLTLTSHGDGARLTLPADALYTVVTASRSDHDAPDGDDIPYVWWEGEAPAETNFPAQTEFSPTEDEKHLLSGGDWLSNAGHPRSRPAGGVRPLRRRRSRRPPTTTCGYGSSGTTARSGGGSTTVTGPCLDDSFGIADYTYIRRFLGADWVHAGSARLAAGRHSFELRLLAGPGEALTACFDAFLLTPGQFVPRGKYKPGEFGGVANEGFAPFEPGTDAFAASPDRPAAPERTYRRRARLRRRPARAGSFSATEPGAVLGGQRRARDRPPGPAIRRLPRDGASPSAASTWSGSTGRSSTRARATWLPSTPTTSTSCTTSRPR